MKNLRVAIIGNTNNYPLLLAEGLREIGCHPTLFVIRKELLHRPESRNPEWSGSYPSWIIDASAVTDQDFIYETDAAAQLLSYLDPAYYDCCILNDIAISLGEAVKMRHIALLTGSDLSYYANYRMVQQVTAPWADDFLRSARGRHTISRLAGLVTRQRLGLLGAVAVSYFPRGTVPRDDALLDEVGVPDRFRTSTFMSDLSSIAYRPPPGRGNLRIFSGARVLWRQAEDGRYSGLDLKGTDILVKGFALYRGAGGQGRLRLPLKGPDVSATRDLIAEVGVADAVTWLKEMSLIDYRREASLADVICDQLAESFPGMVMLDGCAIGRPVLCNFRSEITAPVWGEPAPGLQASSPEEVCERLIWAERYPKERLRLGKEARAFAERRLSPAHAAESLLSGVL